MAFLSCLFQHYLWGESLDVPGILVSILLWSKSASASVPAAQGLPCVDRLDLLFKKDAFLCVRSRVFCVPCVKFRKNQLLLASLPLFSHVVSSRVSALGVEFFLDLVSLLSCRIFIRLAQVRTVAVAGSSPLFV